MSQNYFLMLPILVPIVGGLYCFFSGKCSDEAFRIRFVGAVLGVTALLSAIVLLIGDSRLVLFHIQPDLPVLFKTDSLGRIFIALVVVMWLASGSVSFEYMRHEAHHTRYYGFFLISLGVLIGLGMAGNYMTMYLFYELMTLLTMPLVLHSGTKEAIAAGMKYLFYSIFGASMALIGFFFLSAYGTTLEFTAGGVLDMAKLSGHEGMMLVVTFLVILGFGAKAGMFPLHAWLPTAHPVAPAPASAVLSGVITKAGVLGIIRVVYYLVGADFVRGTWVQTAWMILALITVFMGSMLAYKEKVLKKRLAYSTVSQVSYVLFGLSVMNTAAVTGALLHVIFHSIIKDVLFLCAGAIIYKTHRTDVRDLKGIGKEMPIVMWCFTIVSLALIGIPPLSGFVSKWYLAVGSLEGGVPVLSWVGPVVLLASALLTAGYLFTITIQGFFPGADYDYTKLEKKEPSYFMTVPLIVLTVAAALFGIFPKPLLAVIEAIASAIV